MKTPLFKDINEVFLQADERNVRDSLKGIPTDEIRRILKDKAFPYAVLMEQWLGDFNVSTLVRNANAFGAQEVFYLGKKKWDRRGAVGTHHYIDVNHLATIEDLQPLREKYPTFIGVDNVKGAKSMVDFEWPKDSLLIFGEESQGITNSVLEMCDHIVFIPQYGSVRSLNAGTASGIAMYDLTNKHNAKHR